MTGGHRSRRAAVRQQYLQLRDLYGVAMDNCMQYSILSDRGHVRVIAVVIVADHIGPDIELCGC